MNARGKEVDTTYLSLDIAADRGFIHRDYIAHCLRWSHVAKWLMERKKYASARILDVGCGRELPLAKTLYSMKLIPEHYWGVDYGPINDEDVNKVCKTGKFPCDVWERQDFCDLGVEDLCGRPTVITCFEVLEHVEPEHVIRMLKHMLALLDERGTVFLSTPCWNRRDCAANHVNEMLWPVLGNIIERVGFRIDNVWGTFASIRDYEASLEQNHPQWHDLFNRLRGYYDTNFLSCVFAPLFPAQSRNALWELSIPPRNSIWKRQFPDLEEIPEPWSSSEKYHDFLNI